ncbi:siphovirus Gp157 family protein [Methylomicrobium sp. RS1]|uniref:siphovirus Gp157 family protein n=1 Tax=Candidatus Methylomicrobium oryzae TaxID=2802053 RepID=UPI001923B56A|nr:siphovirus Gp157 family protein [Methylomicrobium sp. RS1]
MPNLTLYQLSAQYLQALDALADPEAELPAEAVSDTLEALAGELEEKAVNVAKFLRNMEATAEAIKAAEANMAKRRKTLENRVQWLKDYLRSNMEHSGITEIECPYFRVTIQSNPPAVEICDEDSVPAEFKEPVVSWKVDKTAIRKALQAGQSVAGASLSQGARLVIK